MQSLISFQCGTLVFSSAVVAVFHSRASIRPLGRALCKENLSYFMQSVRTALIEALYSDLNVFMGQFCCQSVFDIHLGLDWIIEVFS